MLAPVDFIALLLAAPHSRRKPPLEPAEPNWRQRLLGFIRGHPGWRLGPMSEEIGANPGTARYHLRVLERSSRLLVLRGRHRARYFPAETKSSDIPELGMLLRGRVLEVARLVLRQPGTPQHQITRRLKMSRKVFRDYANKLLERRLIEEVRQPHLRQYFPTPRLEALLAQLPPDPPGRKGAPR